MLLVKPTPFLSVLFLEFSFLVNCFRLILDVYGFFFFQRLNPGPLNISDKHSTTELPLGYGFYHVVYIAYQFLGFFFVCVYNKTSVWRKITCGGQRTEVSVLLPL